MPAFYSTEQLLTWTLAYQNQLDRLIPDRDGNMHEKRDGLDDRIASIRKSVGDDIRLAVIRARDLVRDYPHLDGMSFLQNFVRALLNTTLSADSHVSNGNGKYDLGSGVYLFRSDRLGLRQANITLVSKAAEKFANEVIDLWPAGREIRSIGIEGSGPSAAFIYNTLLTRLPACDIRWAHEPKILGHGFFPTDLPFYPCQDLAPFLNDALRNKLNSTVNTRDLKPSRFDRIFKDCGMQIPANQGFVPTNDCPDLYIITYGISPGYAPLVGNLHDELEPKSFIPSIYTPWIRPRNTSPSSKHPLCLVSGASGGAATALMTLFGRQIPDGDFEASLNRFLDAVQREFSGLYGEVEQLVWACAEELIADETHGCQYEPARMNEGTWSAIRRLCNDHDQHAHLLRLLEQCGFASDLSLVLHARPVNDDGGGLSDPFKGSAGPLLSLINYPLLKDLHDNGRLVSLDSGTTSIRWVEAHSQSDQSTSRAVVTRRTENIAAEEANVRDRWSSNDPILAIERDADRITAEWHSAESAQLPAFDHVCLSHGPRLDANLQALAPNTDELKAVRSTRSGRVDTVQFLRALADG